MSTESNQPDIDTIVKRALKSRWSILLVAFAVRTIIIICGVITFVANGVGIHVGGALFRLIPQPNNITINITEYEKRETDCLGRWGLGVELLTFVSVVSIFIIKHIAERQIGKNETPV